jgi:hypothetical protein
MRITFTSALVALTATLAGTAATARHAAATDAACWMGAPPFRWEPPPLGGVIDIPVYIDTSDTHGIQWSGYNSYDYILSVWVALARWNEQSGAKLRFRYAGTVDVGPAEPSELPRGVYLHGVPPSEPGGQVSCDLAFGRANAADADGDGYIDYGWVVIPGAAANCTARTMLPAQLTQVLVHELGHTLGRNDAYENSCGDDHSTVMAQTFPDLTLFDALETQSVYGVRSTITGGSATKRRVLHVSGGAWSGMTTVDSTPRMTRPGPSSSVRNGSLQMAWRETTTSGVMRVVRRMVGTASVGATTTDDVAATSPISIAHAPDGATLMAYVKDNPQAGLSAAICWRLSSNGGSTYGAETCNGTAGYHGVGTAYDPLSKMLVLGFSNYDGNIVLKSLATTQSTTTPRTTTYTGRSGAEGVAIACADTVASGSGNCRVVYAAANRYGQPIEWFDTSISFLGFSSGNIHTTTLFSQNVPAVAWFHNRFHLAYSYLDQAIYHHDMTRTGTSWTYRSTPVTGSGTSWLSPPHLAPTTECNGDICAPRLQLIWLQYQ